MHARPPVANLPTEVMPRDGLSFRLTHVLAPLLGFAVLFLAMHWLDGDQWIADRL